MLIVNRLKSRETVLFLI